MVVVVLKICFQKCGWVKDCYVIKVYCVILIYNTLCAHVGSEFGKIRIYAKIIKRNATNH